MYALHFKQIFMWAELFFSFDYKSRMVMWYFDKVLMVGYNYSDMQTLIEVIYLKFTDITLDLWSSYIFVFQ